MLCDTNYIFEIENKRRNFSVGLRKTELIVDVFSKRAENRERHYFIFKNQFVSPSDFIHKII